MRMQDVDPLGADQLLDRARSNAQPERIERIGSKRNPFRPRAGQLVDQRPGLCCNQCARSNLQQHAGNVDDRARRRLFAQGGHDLQDGRTGERARGGASFESFVHERVLAAQN